MKKALKYISLLLVFALLAVGATYVLIQRANAEPLFTPKIDRENEEIIPEAAREMLRHAFLDLGMERIWCGYYDGNENSRRVQEKLGFAYHHTTEGCEVKQLHELRTGHVSLMTKSRWQKVMLFREQKILLDTFLANGAITVAQYNKSFGDLVILMEMRGVE